MLSKAEGVSFDEFFKFSFVRNPWDRIVSYYAMVDSYRQKSYALAMCYNFIEDTFGSFNFDSFIDYVQLAHYRALPVNLDCSPRDAKDMVDPFVATMSHELFPQTYWLTLNGVIDLDFLGRFENVQEDFSKLCKQIKIPSHRGLYKHKMRSERVHYSDYYNSYTRDLVGDLFKDDVEQFSYDF